MTSHTVWGHNLGKSMEKFGLAGVAVQDKDRQISN